MNNSYEGITLMSVLLGFVGAVLGISYMPPMSKKQVFSALGSGVACAALIPPLVASFLANKIGWEVPLLGHHLLGLFFGVGGMFIIPGVIVFWQSASKNPMAIVDWLRGKSPPPPPPPPTGVVP